MFHPAVDFLMAGGGSIIVAIPVILLIHDKAAVLPTALWLGLLISTVLNYPHFAHSYQLLYAGIGARIAGAETTTKVRLRYLWAGFVAPVLIGGFLFGAYMLGTPRVLGYAANAFAFTTGWHYVKQGYGVIVVLSAIRRIYYTNLQKRLLLLNGYVVWVYSWMALNKTLSQESVYGVKYFTLSLPPLMLQVGAAAAVLTTAATVLAFAHRAFVQRQPVSLNGIVGYASSLYLWVIAFYWDPIFTVFIPAFHSLQYMLFVWRYELNKVSFEAGHADGPTRPVTLRFAAFVVGGLVLGWIGFIGLPFVLHSSLHPDPRLWGPTVFVFIFVIWINIHHYFIDNVLWRRDNDDVRRFLFAPR